MLSGYGLHEKNGRSSSEIVEKRQSQEMHDQPIEISAPTSAG